MDKLITAILFIGIPMALTQLLYRLFDHKAKRRQSLLSVFLCL